MHKILIISSAKQIRAHDWVKHVRFLPFLMHK